MGPAVVLAAAPIAYLIGSIPSAYLITRFAQGVDIRRVGTGNVGTLNTFKQVGPVAGIAVLLLDVLKGVLAVSFPEFIRLPEDVHYFTAIAVVAGHNWPLFLGFHGGKGASTVAGVSLAVMPLLTLIAIGFTLFMALVSRNAVAGIVSGYLALNVLIMATVQDWLQIGLCLFLSLVVAGTYLGGSWQQTVTALRRRHWVDLLNFE